jgi:protocatechuate 3,4-dioxygenase beta subunit
MTSPIYAQLPRNILTPQPTNPTPPPSQSGTPSLTSRTSRPSTTRTSSTSAGTTSLPPLPSSASPRPRTSPARTTTRASSSARTLPSARRASTCVSRCKVVDVESCKPLEGARVDVWQANALSVYSATNTSWLREWQPTSNWGTADFDTIFPGNYAGRNVHTHVAVRPKDDSRFVHTGQIFFDEWPRQQTIVSVCS